MKQFICTFAAVIFMAVSVFAEIKLPEGFVKGLPEALTAMDEDGYSPDPENGEIYIYIPDMIPGELYTKDISLMNLRDDAEYNIYMTATPNYSEGNVDMLNETLCKLYLDDKLIYEGLVNGDGTPNMQENGLDLGGLYKSGVSRNLHAEFVWNWSGKTTYDLEDKSSYYGEVSFYWTFYAQIQKPDNSNNSSSSGGGGKIIRDNSSEDSEESDIPTGTDNITDTDNYDNNSTDNSHDSNHSNPADSHNPDEIKEEIIPDKPEDPGIIEKIVDKLPLIPEDVKTGYYSEIVFYTKIAIGALIAAMVILALIAYKILQLKRLKKQV